MDKLLVTYNICGIETDNTEEYITYLENVVKQKFDGRLEIIVSACLPNPRTLPILKEKFPQCHYNEIHDKLPINVTFNHSILEGIDRLGEFDAYVYVTCDALMDSEYTLQGLFNLIKNNDHYGMVSAQIDVDSCYAYGLKLGRHHGDDAYARHLMFKDGNDYVVPVGRACAAHVNFYSNKIFKYYGRGCPDIFAGYCTESVWSFVCAALKLNWVISKDYMIRHHPNHPAGMDVPSAGFRPETENNGKPAYDHAFMQDSLLPIFVNDRAKELGLGYEECQNLVLHDPTQFDDNQFCINDELKEYIKDNLYLSSDIFDYETIKHTWSDKQDG